MTDNYCRLGFDLSSRTSFGTCVAVADSNRGNMIGGGCPTLFANHNALCVVLPDSYEPVYLVCGNSRWVDVLVEPRLRNPALNYELTPSAFLEQLFSFLVSFYVTRQSQRRTCSCLRLTGRTYATAVDRLFSLLGCWVALFRKKLIIFFPRRHVSSSLAGYRYLLAPALLAGNHLRKRWCNIAPPAGFSK